MLIRDLEQLEVISEGTQVEGGVAFADGSAGAYANGNYFAATNTSTYTSASAGGYYYDWWYGYYYYGPSASSSSYSSSTAA